MIYLDHHATTPCDPRVVEAMLPWLTDHFGNPHSSHSAGRQAAEKIDASIQSLAQLLNVPADSVVVSSGATESNNLAIRGVCLHPRQKRRQIVTCSAEHPAILDVVADLEREGFSVTRVPPFPQGHPREGCVDVDRLSEVISSDTAIVSIMWANNEIGSIAPIKEIAKLCHDAGALLHTDATQAIGRIPVNIIDADVDLLSASAHKFYGPKGIGFLTVGNGNRRVRLLPQITGGGQQRSLRAGTMNPAGIVGMQSACSIAIESLCENAAKLVSLRKLFWELLQDGIKGLALNGPEWDSQYRLPGNLNVRLEQIEGEAWMAATPEVAFSSGSACSNVEGKPSHVLMAIGLSESEARRSVRFGLGQENDEQQISQAADYLVTSLKRLHSLM